MNQTKINKLYQLTTTIGQSYEQTRQNFERTREFYRKTLAARYKADTDTRQIDDELFSVALSMELIQAKLNKLFVALDAERTRVYKAYK